MNEPDDQANKQNRAPDVSIGHSERAAQDAEDPRERREREQAEQEAQFEDAVSSAGTVEEKVIAALRQVYDPEIPVNIYELGLIYDVDIDQENNVSIRMTLTSPACPVAEQLPGEVRGAAERVPEVKSASVELTFEPAWSMEMMSEEAKLMLGFM